MKTIRRFVLRCYLFLLGYCWEHLTLSCPECRRRTVARVNGYVEEIKASQTRGRVLRMTAPPE